jgi:hypothetical protein
MVFASRKGFLGIELPSVVLMIMNRGQMFEELSPYSSDEVRARFFFFFVLG